MKNRFLRFSPGPFAALLSLAAVVAISSSARAQGTTPTALYDFAATDTNNVNVGGAVPESAPIQGRDGNFYGTTVGGGANGAGTVYRLAPDGTLTTLHDFGAYIDQRQQTNADGVGPHRLVQGSDGDFYGTAFSGGTAGRGTAYKVTAGGAFTLLYEFAATAAGVNADGAGPGAALIQGADGNFYGTATTGGPNAQGTVFQLTPSGTLTTVHAFAPTAGDGTNGEGASPSGALLQSNDGTFYGTATNGGADARGAVFSMTPSGAVSLLHSFTRTGGEGVSPRGSLVRDSAGVFYGTTGGGGASGQGTVFQITATGGFATLYSFGVRDNTGANATGAQPTGDLCAGSDGNFYGTTFTGGANSAGTVFRVTAGGALTSLYSFNAVDYSVNNGANVGGGNPSSGVIQGADGNLYGSTTGGGAGGSGVIYQLPLTTGSSRPAFFAGEASLGSGVYYLAFAGGNPFGYYSYLSDERYLFHFDLGYEFIFDAADGKNGVYLYDFASNGFFYTSPTFPFPYLYDFTLNTVLYYFPDPTDPTHYNTGGVRYFYRFDNGTIFSK